MKEIEAKFTDIDKDALRSRLGNLGYVCEMPEILMRRKILKFQQDREGYYARVRDEGTRITMTVKNHVGTGINDVYEAEVMIDDFDRGVLLLEMAGWRVKAYQETLREIWRHLDQGIDVTVDTWPSIPAFCEIEASDEQIVRTAAEALGFNWDDALFGAVDTLYWHHIKLAPDIINNLPEITFDNPPCCQDKAIAPENQVHTA